jgi:hypothetical protein
VEHKKEQGWREGNLSAEQKYRNHGIKKETRLARRNKLNLNMEQKYRNHGTKKGTKLREGKN